MYLQLADNGGPNILDHMLQVRNQYGKPVWVREDQLDNLTDAQLYEILQSQPHLNGIKDMFQAMRARKDARVEAKSAVKYAKADAIQSGTYQSPLDKITGAVSNVFGRGQEPAPVDTRGWTMPMITGDASVGVNKWYQNPLTLGAIAIGVLGIGYFATRSRTNK